MRQNVASGTASGTARTAGPRENRNRERTGTAREAGLQEERDCKRSGTARGAGLQEERDCKRDGTARETGLQERRDCERSGTAEGGRRARALPGPRSPGFTAVPQSSRFRSPRGSAVLAV